VAKVISVAVTPRYPFAPLGQVTQAKICLEGHFFALQPKKGLSSNWLLHATCTNSDDCILAATFTPDYPQEIESLVAAEFFCLMLHGAEPRGEQDLGHASGLVLTKADTDIFVRVGLFESHVHCLGNENMLNRDGCTCQDRGPEARRRWDRELMQVLLCKPLRTITIE